MKKYLWTSLNLRNGLFSAFILFMVFSCNTKNDDQNENEIALPVYKIDTATVVISESFLGTMEGKITVEIRPQVGGELQEAYVDEGDYVEKGQKLFKINPQIYQQDLNQAEANANVARAQLDNAAVEVNRLKPLIDNQVMSPVRLEKARSDYRVAEANLKQAMAEVANAEIQMNYTIIQAPVSGYIGRIPKRIGNVVNPGDREPITVLTDVQEIYVYFSISESDFYKLLNLNMQNKPTDTLQNGSTTSRSVSLLLSNGTLYPERGVIDASSGQVNKSTGSILLRATFPNSNNILRSGNTGTVVLDRAMKGKITIPREATFELQAKTFVQKVDAQNRVVRQAIVIEGEAPNNRYIVAAGLKPGDRILVSGLDKVTDSTKIKPLPYTQDTLVAPRVYSNDPDTL